MKTTIKNILKRKGTNLLIMLEMLAAMVYFIVVACAMQQVFYVNIKMPEQIDCDTNRFITIFTEGGLSAEKYDEYKRKLEKLDSIDCFEYFNDEVVYASDSEDEIFSLAITKGVLKFKKFGISEGRMLTKKDFKSKLASVLIGREIANSYGYSIGDKIKLMIDDKNITYEIVGILDKDSTIFMDDIQEGVVNNLDNAIVRPVLDENMFFNGLRFFALASNSSKAKEAIKEIKTVFDKSGDRCEATLASDVLDKSFKEKFEANKRWLILASYMIIFSIISVTTIVFSNLYTRKKEIGVRMAMGYSKIKIYKMMVEELVCITFIALVVALVFAISSFGMTENTSNYCTVRAFVSPIIIVVTIFIAIFFVVVPTIGLIVKIKKFHPKVLIGGKE